MNTSATQAHLLSELARISANRDRSKDIAHRGWGREGYETRAWHRENAYFLALKIARIERACSYLLQRRERFAAR